MVNLLKEGLTADSAYVLIAGANAIRVEVSVSLYRIYKQ
jgi:hypothetical protein